MPPRPPASIGAKSSAGSRPAVPIRPAGRRPAGAAVRTLETARRLATEYPVAECALVHTSALELLVATILSAQCTDQRVNMVTPHLFARYPTVGDLAGAKVDEMEKIVQSTGFFRSKTKAIREMAQDVVGRYSGEVPDTMEELVTLRGVGRKTANVVLGVAFGKPGLPVDTHVTRLVGRLKLSAHMDPVNIESDICSMLPPPEWTNFSLRLIAHGRLVCGARKPLCSRCLLNDICPSSQV